MEHGVYDKRRNRAEADYIAHVVRALLTQRSGLSIGVVAFSEAQQDEIEAALGRLAQQDREFRDVLDAEMEREVDGQFVGLLVKNLENIQGDERDIIILSICYGHGPNGKMLMNFGPINKSGGEKRLNVAFSRAKHHMAVVSSIHYGDITNEYNDGANCLKNYLRYAESVSVGDGSAAQRVLRGASRWYDQPQGDEDGDSDSLVEQITAALSDHGFLVDGSVGQSHFRCDLAVRCPGDEAYRLGILVDGDTYYDQADVLERDMMRPRLLRGFGWNVAFVLAKDWYEKRDEVMARLLRLAEACEGEHELEDIRLDDEDLEEDPENDDEPWDGMGEANQVVEVEPLGDEDDGELSLDLSVASGGSGTASGGEQPDRQEPAAGDASANADGEAGGATDSLASDTPTRCFEFTGGNSNKFWEITLSDNQHTVRYGRIGSRGQTKTKTFPDSAAAKRDFERLIRSKLAKGYKER